MAENEFVEREKQEQNTQNAKNIEYIIEVLRGVVSDINDLKKELRTVRQELRNIDKLRPLKNTEGLSQDLPEAAGEVTA